MNKKLQRGHRHSHLINPCCPFSSKAGRSTGHDAMHTVEWAATAINNSEKNQIWRTGGGNWWDHTYPYVSVSTRARVCACKHAAAQKAWIRGNGDGVRLTSCRLADRWADKTTEKQQNTDQDQTESITATESREVTLRLLQLLKNCKGAYCSNKTKYYIHKLNQCLLNNNVPVLTANQSGIVQRQAYSFLKVYTSVFEVHEWIW